MSKNMNIGDNTNTVILNVTGNLQKNGKDVATLDENGKVPSSQLPSYVDDVLEYSAKASFPIPGESNKIYIDISDNKTYRWSGNIYVEISPSLALGETSSTAYAGDKGKANAEAISALQSGKMDRTTVLTGGSQTSSSSEDGGSNVYTFTKSDGTTSTLTIKNGSKGSKGDTGATGATGSNGLSIGSITKTSTSGLTDTYTAKLSNGTSVGTFTVTNGAAGKDGTNGTNGKDGANGVSCTHSWSGTTLSVTSASGTSSANLKGDKGDKGDTGPQGPKGDTGATGATGSVASITTTGSGNAITNISMDPSTKAVTATKGSTFLTSHQDISGKANTSGTYSGLNVGYATTAGSADKAVGIVDYNYPNKIITIGWNGESLTPEQANYVACYTGEGKIKDMEFGNFKTRLGNATPSDNGLMSSTDKSKLDGIATGATKIVKCVLNGKDRIPDENGIIDLGGAVTANSSPSFTNVSATDVNATGKLFLKTSTYSSYWSNNGSNTYLLLTNSGGTSSNSFRPFTLNNAGGYISAIGKFGCNLVPNANKTYSLGASTNDSWKTVYVNGSTISTSDRNDKRDIDYDLIENIDDIYSELKPCSYYFKEGDRIHFGLVAQDCEETINKYGYSIDDISFICRDAIQEEVVVKDAEWEEITTTEVDYDESGNLVEKEVKTNKMISDRVTEMQDVLDENGNKQYKYGLRYEELIALNMRQIQKLMKENQELKERLSKVEKFLGIDN